MFTGLVEETGTVESVSRRAEGLTFNIRASKILQDMKIGDSIAINGCCQTVEKFDHRGFEVFSIPETLSVTNFSLLKAGDAVNLERALAFGDRIGGHLVQGHVEGTATVVSLRKTENIMDVTLDYDSEYIIAKGSVCLDGISLTVQKKEGKLFSVQIIPETIRLTNIAAWSEGGIINLETDYIIKSLDQVMLNRSQRSR